MSTEKKRAEAVITPVGTGCYVFLSKPQPGMNPGDEPQFAITLVFPKSTDLKALKQAAQAAAIRKWGDKIPPNLRSPFRDGNIDKSDDATFADSIFITARTKQMPGLVGRDRQPLPDPAMDAYSGMQCRASITAFAYDQKGNKGVSFALNNVQKVSDGARLSGRKPADQDFEGAADLPEDEGAPATTNGSMFD